MNTVKCPSCGAAANNLQNCDFCGSLFVRSENLGYDSSKIFNTGLINQIFPGLKEELDLNLKYQNDYDCDYFGTSAYSSKHTWSELSERGGIMQITNSDFSYNENSKGLRGNISIDMSKDKLTSIQLSKFKQMEEFKLFNKVDDDWYKIDFGKDTKGAAYLASKILVEIYGYSLSNNLFFSSDVDCLVEGSEEDLEIWWNKQTEEYRQRENKLNISMGGGELFSQNIVTENKPSPEKQQKKGPCFIATATMGDYDHPTVIELRDFRDNWILKKSWGDSFVKWYYHYGEIAAKKIENNTALRKISYWFIVKPLYVLSKLIDK